jgi:rhamnosyltransferase
MGGSGASVSIVIPTRDAGRAFGTVLHRLMGQGLEPLEILVVDAGSQDGTRHIVSQFPDAHFVESPVPPGPATWNFACQEARGELVAFLSQDAVPADGDWLKHLAAALEEPSVGAAYGRQEAAPGSDPIIAHRLSRRFPKEPASRRARFGDPVTYASLAFSIDNAAIRRTAFRGIHFNEHLHIGADRAWTRQILLASYTVAYVPEAGVERTLHHTLSNSWTDAILTGWTDEYLDGDGGTMERRGTDSGWKEAWQLTKSWRWDRLAFLTLEDAVSRYGYKLGRRLHRLAPSIRGRIAPEIAMEEPHRPLTEREKAA